MQFSYRLRTFALPELPGAWNWEMPNFVFKNENFWISLSKALLT